LQQLQRLGVVRQGQQSSAQQSQQTQHCWCRARLRRSCTINPHRACR
jgi:hypothetical protein